MIAAFELDLVGITINKLTDTTFIFWNHV